MRGGAPIGVFDSGLGGVSVLREIRASLPAESLLYCADHAFLPYGERDPAAIRERGVVLGRWLAQRGCKALVIACNTATAAAAEALRAAVTVPVVGMEPAVKPAAAATRSGVIGVLGTGGTLASARFAGLLERFAGDVRVVTRPCPELVEAAESGMTGTARTRLLAHQAIAPLLAAGADVIVLGCTHFPLLRPEIDEAVGRAAAVIDTGPAVAGELARRLGAAGLRRTGSVAGESRFWTTAPTPARQSALERLWPGGVFERARLPDERAATGE